MKHISTKRNLLLSAFSLLIVNAFAQHTVRGTLTDAQSKEPIEFANIGIIGKGVGTVTDEKGNYSLVIPDSVAKEPLRISRIGYKTKELSVGEAEKTSGLTLTESATALTEVAVSAKKLKVKIVGNDTKTRKVTGAFKKNNLGAELAIKLNIKEPKTQLRKFYINIASNTIENPVFRFNVYNVGADGRPKENILTHNIVFEPKEKTGLVTLDLMQYNIYVDEDVFIAIEWVKDLGDTKGLSFSTKLVGSATYFRQASQDKWEKMAPIGVGLHAEIGY